MGLSAFVLIMTFVIFDDELCALNSCVIMGMLNFINLTCYVIKIHSCCW